MLDTEIVSGEWPLVGARTIEHQGVDLDAIAEREGGSSTGLGAARPFLEAYFGLRPWDESYDPRANELILVPGVAPPSTRRYLREMFERRLVEVFGCVPSEIESGPASMHVILAYPGTSLPRLIDLPKPRQLSAKLVATVPGAHRVRWGGGGGVFDLFVETTDASSARAAIDAAARELRLEHDVLVESYPAIGFATEDER